MLLRASSNRTGRWLGYTANTRTLVYKQWPYGRLSVSVVTSAPWLSTIEKARVCRMSIPVCKLANTMRFMDATSFTKILWRGADGWSQRSDPDSGRCPAP